MSRLEEFVADSDVKDALRRALRKLEQAKTKTADLTEAVYQAVRDGVSALTIPAVPKPKTDKRKSRSETAIAVLSDWQLAKVTPSYDSATCEERVESYARKVEELTAIQRADHPVEALRVYLLGDLVEGEMIFPGQAHRVDASLYRQVTVDGPRILSAFLRRMASVFPKVHVVGVIGNHGALGGRARRDYHPESNADAMLYEVVRLLTEPEPRITWASNVRDGERNWYAVDRVGDKGFLLFHGDQVKGGFAGFPWYGFGKKLQGWAMGAIPEPFDYALAGHFHTPTRMYLNGISLWVNGSTESANTYAAEQLAAAGEPCQWLLFAHPENGITAEYLVAL